MSRSARWCPLFAGLFLALAGNLWGILLQEGNAASQHLAGEWRLVPDLSERLTGHRSGAPERISISSDSSVLVSLPPPVKALLKTTPAYLAGTLTFSSARFSYVLTVQEGSLRLLCFQPGLPSVVTSILFDVIPATEPQNDLLFLGGEKDGQPYFAYERVALPKTTELSDETRSLLLDALSHTYSEALSKLPERPDWQGVVDLLTEEMREDPNGQHNNRCLVLSSILARHLREARLDVEPLLAVLKSHSWTNQQKVADILAEAVRRPELFNGREKEAIRAVIPLTASQRGPVVEPALRVLHAVTGAGALERDPRAWAGWFESRFGEKLDLRGSVYERVTVLSSERSTAGALTFRMDGKPVQDESALRSQLKTFLGVSQAAGLRPSFVVLIPTPVTSSETQDKALRDAQPIRDVLRSLEHEEMTLAPAGTVFYPPFEPGFPAQP